MRRGRCDGCGREAVTNFHTGKVVGIRAVSAPGEYCADCYDRLNLVATRPAAERRGRAGRDEGYDGSGAVNASGSFDNAVRAWEDG